MKKTLKVVGILLILFFAFCAYLLPQPTHAQNMVTTTINVGSEPDGVAITPNGNYAYVTHYVNSSVSVINTATKKIIENISAGIQLAA